MSENPVFDRIERDIANDDLVLYMKGSPIFPQCGFSAAVVQILEQIEVPFQAYDVLQDPELREGVKAYSDWPTIPQLYVKGEFMGGSDIVREMFSSGELQEHLKKKGVGNA